MCHLGSVRLTHDNAPAFRTIRHRAAQRSHSGTKRAVSRRAPVVEEKMGRTLTYVVLIVVCGVALSLAGAGRVAAVLTFAGVAAVTALTWRCRHSGPLGLLPPTTNADGTRTAAQWYCDACGKSWPAVFDRSQQPVRRFEGYDESKAVDAARRADELYRKQHAIARKRAGYETLTQRPRRAPAAVVSIDQQVRLAK